MKIVFFVVFMSAEGAGAFMNRHTYRPKVLVRRVSPGDDSWVKALREAEGKDIKENTIWSTGEGADDKSRAANRLLLGWLEKNGVYLSEASAWGSAPHPLGLSPDTFDENNDNEVAIADRAFTTSFVRLTVRRIC